MHPVTRLFRELSQLQACIDRRDFSRYLGCILAQWRGVLGRRTLAPADAAMTGTVTATVAGKRINVPLDTMTALVASHDATPTFGSVREIFASNVYLRAFKPGLRAGNVVDLGCNRGMFLMLAAHVLEPTLAIGVEPQTYFEPVFEALAAANETRRSCCVRLSRFVASSSGPDKVTMAEILQNYRIDRIGFLKCDIEGVEFDIFLNDAGFLDRVDNIAMELHHTCGDARRIESALRSRGFETRPTDQFGAICDVLRAEYLYASRSGALSGRR